MDQSTDRGSNGDWRSGNQTQRPNPLTHLGNFWGNLSHQTRRDVLFITRYLTRRPAETLLL